VDIVVVPLEVGDRVTALNAIGRTEIVIDLTPASRSSRTVDVLIIDNLIRAVPNVTTYARDLADTSSEKLCEIVEVFDAEETLAAAETAIWEGLLATPDGA
jgi:4-phosphopantoate--beta-alanine ligase